mmetsp:Transcript_34663/g.73062  ORF Transcript_34663/g.73062 Transcript_34663/m.73062 type:complete len:87 (-) Transcript_34663:63-323(-)
MLDVGSSIDSGVDEGARESSATTTTPPVVGVTGVGFTTAIVGTGDGLADAFATGLPVGVVVVVVRDIICKGYIILQFITRALLLTV